MEESPVSSDVVDSTVNEEDIGLYEHISFRENLRLNSLPVPRRYLPTPIHEFGVQPSFSDRIRNLSSLMPHRPFPIAHRSISALDTANRGQARRRSMAQSGSANTSVSVITHDDLNNISPIGGRAVMERVISANVVLLPKCILYPRISGIPSFSSQERPPGCKTVSACGLPADADEAFVEGVFQLCGEISRLLKHEETVWYIRYSDEVDVENAIGFNGCLYQIEDGNGLTDSCKLIVTYVRTRLDLYEHQERVFEREVRAHLENELSGRPASTYSHREAVSIVQKFNRGESVSESLLVIHSWVESGKLVDRNAYQFYIMLQSIKCYLRNLMNEKSRRGNEVSEENRRAQVRIGEVLGRSNVILVLFISVSDIGKTFFSKRQMENLNLWKMEIINILNNFIRQRNSNRSTGSAREDKTSNPIVDVSADEVDDMTRINNTLKRVSDMLSQAQANQNIYESHLLTSDSDARSIQEHEDIQDLIWCTQELYGRASFFLRSAYNSQSED